MSKTTAIVVARADLLGHVALHPEAPEVVAVPAGNNLQVKLLFNYAELSKEKDEFTLELHSSLAGNDAAPMVHQHHDRRGRPDDEQGFLMQSFPSVPVGNHVLSWAVHVIFTDGDAKEETSIKGQVKVNVE